MAAMQSTAVAVDAKQDSDLWLKGRAIFEARLKGQKKYASDLTDFLRNGASVESARDQCLQLKDKAEGQYSKGDVTIGGKKIFPKAWIEKVVQNLHYAVDMGNLLVKGAPETVGLAWMAVKTMIGAVQQDYAISSYIIVALADLTSVLVRCRSKVKTFYVRSREKSEIEDQLFTRIPEIYAEILHFSFWVQRHFRKGNWKRFNPLSVDRFTPKMEGIQKLELEVTKDTADVSNERMVAFQDKAGQDLVIIADSQRHTTAAVDDMAADMKLVVTKLIPQKKTHMQMARDEYDENIKKLNPVAGQDVTYDEHLNKRTEGTHDWILKQDQEQYDQWNNADKSMLLWLSGKEGSGKSVLTAAVIEKVKTFEAPLILEYFFCTEGDTSDRVKATLLAGLYEQASESQDLLTNANDCFRLPKKGKATGGDDDLKAGFTTGEMDDIISKLLIQVFKKEFYLFVDAFDHLSESGQDELLTSLRKLMDDGEVPVKVFVSSRLDVDPPEGDEVQHISLEEHNDFDIEQCIQAEISKLPGFTDAERHLACEEIARKADGVFRYLQQAIDFLAQPWQRPLSKRLESLPDDLEGSYTQALRQVDPNYADLLRTSLMWTTLAQGQIELIEIMDDFSRVYKEDAVDAGVDDAESEEEYGRLYAKQMRTAGGAFLEVSGSPRIVRLKNKSVRKFFLDQENFQSRRPTTVQDVCNRCRSKIDADPSFYISEKDGHLKLAITCLQHLNSQTFQKLYLKPPAEAENGADTSSDSASEDSDDRAVLPDQTSKSEDLRAGNVEQEKVDDAPPDENAGKEHLPATDGIVDAVGEVSGQVQQTDTNGENGTHSLSDESANDDDADSDDEVDDTGVPQELNFASRNNSLRYELVHWATHVKRAESLWTEEDRAQSDDWKLLWALLEQFLCKSPEAFKNWQRCMWNVPDTIFWYCDDDFLQPLHVAAGLGIAWLVRKLIERGEDVKGRSTVDRFPIHYCIDEEESQELIDLLLDVDVNDETEHSKSFPVFHWLFIENPTLERVQSFFARGANCTHIEKDGSDVMHWFAWNCSRVEVLDLLLQQGANINVGDADGETPLHRFLSRREPPLELLKAFLAKGADVNAEDKQSQMPLWEAALEGNVEVVKILLEHNADIHDKDENGTSAIHAAALNGHTEVVRMLVDAGIAVNEPSTMRKRSPFFNACSSAHAETAKYLLQIIRERDAGPINQSDALNKTPLRSAAAHGLLDVVKDLCSHAPNDINKQDDKHKRTALHAAAANGKKDVVNYLLDIGADATIQDAHGNTALSLCHERWLPSESTALEETLICLIEHDIATAVADVDILADAAIKGSMPVLRKLLDLGADPDAKDKHDWTPKVLAKQYRQSEAYDLLSKASASRGARPSGWISTVSAIKALDEGLTLEWVGPGLSSVISNHPIPSYLGEYYFEITILPDPDAKTNIFVAVGLCNKPSKVQEWAPGWYQRGALSWGFHGDDGFTACQNIGASSFTETFGPGNTVGCGVNFEEESIFWTKDGHSFGKAYGNATGRLYPVIGINEKAKVEVNFGNDTTAKPFKWGPANSPDFSAHVDEDGGDVENVANGAEDPDTRSG